MNSPKSYWFEVRAKTREAEKSRAFIEEIVNQDEFAVQVLDAAVRQNTHMNEYTRRIGQPRNDHDSECVIRQAQRSYMQDCLTVEQLEERIDWALAYRNTKR